MTRFELIERSKAHNVPRPFVMAHRGNSAHCPENTLAAFRRAIDEGTDGIETDLHLSADGVLMCIHDDTLERTTSGHGEVKAMTCKELQTLSAGYGRPEFAGERIPTLREVLELLPENMFIGLELKTDDFLDRAVCRQLATLLAETNSLNRAFALSFSRARLEAIRTHTPEMASGLITLFDLLPDRGGEFVGPFWPMLVANPLYARIAHRRGQLVCPLDPTPEARLWYYRLLGCDAVLTNDPAKTLRALGRR
jgi:glycerophosphoryl diester phosphodiesterase